MSLNFSANQFEAEYKPSKLRNWEIPRWHPERPCGNKGTTLVLSNEKGHLLPGVPRSFTNPWGNFVGTWDLPNKISREEAFKLSAPTIDKIQKWRRHCQQQGCPQPLIPKIYTVSKRAREANSSPLDSGKKIHQIPREEKKELLDDSSSPHKLELLKSSPEIEKSAIKARQLSIPLEAKGECMSLPERTKGAERVNIISELKEESEDVIEKQPVVLDIKESRKLCPIHDYE